MYLLLDILSALDIDIKSMFSEINTIELALYCDG
jgi:hypothetical protein